MPDSCVLKENSKDELMTIRIIFYFAVILFFHQSLLFAQEAEMELDCTAGGCHGSYLDRSHIHPPVEDDCASCHESNGFIHPGSEGKEFSLLNEMPFLCYDCHDAKDEKDDVHAPVVAGECTACHDVHSSNNAALLIAADQGEICGKCHDLYNNPKAVNHPPAENNQCTECHNPHQSDYAAFLKKESPQLCFDCHEEQKDELALNNVHPAYEGECSDCHHTHTSQYASLLKMPVPGQCYECHEDQSDNISVHKAINDGRACLDCHKAHASEMNGLLTLQREELCLTCHDTFLPVEYSRSGKIKNRLEEKEFIHPPAMDGGCESCHLPHSSEFTSLLNADFPNGDYAPGDSESFAVCFNCHETSLIEDPGNDASGFSDGKQNLHYLHVKRDKGRNCMLCHDMHGSNQEHLIAGKVSFGKWKMPVRIGETEEGKMCYSGCHEKKQYGGEVGSKK